MDALVKSFPLRQGRPVGLPMARSAFAIDPGLGPMQVLQRDQPQREKSRVA